MNFSLFITGLLAFITAHLLYVIYSQITSPLHKIPGPYIARFTRLWYFNRVRPGKFHHENIELHQKYGLIVRVALNLYSINMPNKTVYGIGSKFTKSD